MGSGKHGHGSGKHGHGSGKHDGQETARSILHLNALLVAELSAVETYKLVLDNLDRTTKARTNLEACLQSHRQRIGLLRETISQLGGSPATGGHAWDSLAKAIEDGTEPLDDRAAIAGLEEAEDHGDADYRRELGDLHASARQLVEFQLLPKQIETHRTISELKRQLH